jgi:hypothetical protein
MLAPFLLALDLAGAVDVSDRTELRVRAPGTNAAASVDVETDLTARLSLRSRRWTYTLEYAPTLTLWDLSAGPAVEPAFFNAGDARVQWQGRSALVSLEENAGYGLVDFASTPVVPGTEGQPPSVTLIPGLSLLPFMSSTTTLTSRLTLPRWTVDISAGYQLAGGATEDAQALLPLSTGPFGEARVDYAALRRDHVFVTLSASDTAFSSGPDDLLVEPSLGYRHLWSRSIETSLRLGVSEGHTRASAVSAEALETFPVVEGVVERRTAREGQLDARASARLGPVINRLVGIVEERVEANLSASYLRRKVTARGFVSASRSVPATGLYATSLFAGELGTAYGAAKLVTVDTGVRFIWQRQEATGVAFSQGTLFLGVTLRAPRWSP